MTRASFLTVVLVVLGPVSTACQSEPDSPAEPEGPGPSAGVDRGETGTAPAVVRESTASTGERDLLIAELTTRLDRAQTAGPGEQVSTGGGVALEPLLGMTRPELRAAFGAPRTCGRVRGAEPGGDRAPCGTYDDWFYSFYHLPQGAHGGGPELLLQFDEKGTCVSARWVITR